MLLDFCRGLPRPSRVAGFVATLLVVTGCKDSPSEPETGSLVVTITGLPSGAPGAVAVVGPAGSNYLRQLSASETLNDLPTGTYTIQAPPVGVSANVYVATPATQQAVVSHTETATVTVPYLITTGSMDVAISGLPAGSQAAVLITGPQGFSRMVTAATVITGLVPGVYSLSSDAVTTPEGNVYSAIPFSQTVAVSASETPKRVSSTYSLITGGLDVAVSGLPFGASPRILVFGPGGYSRELTEAASLNGLFPGSYTVAGSNVTTPGGTYVPTVPSSTVLVTASLTHAQASVTYVLENQPPPVSFNLLIDGMYVTQAVQTYAGGVPLVTGRPGLLRVFVKSTTPNTAQPTVRVQFYDGPSLVQTVMLDPQLASVPTAISEASLTFSWNAIVDASLMKPGLRILAEVDPASQYAESNEADNSFPVNGVPLAVNVQPTAPLPLTFVPVQQSSGLTGNVTDANQATFLTFAKKVLPVRDYASAVHAPFVTSAELTSDGAGWSQVLLELNALRTAEGSQSHYMGIVNVPYSSGTAGFGLVRAFTTVVWDKQPSAPSIAAHELGHNFGRLHAPCGAVASPDPNFPYPGGVIGVHGYDVETGVLMPPTTSDLMGYCGFGWISDYTYAGIFNYRMLLYGGAALPNVAGAQRLMMATRTAGPAMVVWGQIVDGQPSLEPAFMADTRMSLPSRPGPNRVEALGANGRIVFSYSFEGDELADIAGHSVRQFAFAVPIDSSAAGSITTIRLIAANGSRSEWSAQAGVASPAGAVEATATRAGEVLFRLAGGAARLAVVRERASGQIVAFVRGRPVIVRSRAAEFDVQVSDGIHSSRTTVRPLHR